MAADWQDNPPDPDADWDEDPEGPQACDLADATGDESITVPCPHCGAPVSELAEQCPHCGDWIIHGTAAARRSVPFIVIAVVLIIALLFWLL
jgi:predicted RNA-binding Zn-ribbon protein involved in translation (DUF1610 family)